MPKSAFINALDFPVPAELAKYLKYLQQNATAYNSYFAWKQHVTFKEPVELVCSMCIALHLETHFGIKKGVVNNLGSYWSKNDCKIPSIEQVIRFTFEDYKIETYSVIAEVVRAVEILQNIRLRIVDIILVVFLISLVALFLLNFGKDTMRIILELFKLGNSLCNKL